MASGLAPTDSPDVVERATAVTRGVEDLIFRYRERWGIEPDAPLFGVAVGEIQEAHRRELVAAIQDAFRDELATSSLQHDRTVLTVDL